MTNAARKIVVVNSDTMMNDTLYRTMKTAHKSKVQAMLDAINEVVEKRTDFESKVERRLGNGTYAVQQSNDIKHVQALKDNDTIARFFVALRIDPQSYLFPQSQVGGKSSSETSNLKAYKKMREIAEVIYSGVSSLENVAKVFSVCAYIAATKRNEVIERRFCEHFLRSNEFKAISQGSEDFWNAIDQVRATSLASDAGASTQASQMIRTLVALKSAKDVKDGRSKNVAVDANGLVIKSLMRRFGQLTDTTPEAIEQSEEQANEE